MMNSGTIVLMSDVPKNFGAVKPGHFLIVRLMKIKPDPRKNISDQSLQVSMNFNKWRSILESGENAIDRTALVYKTEMAR